MSKHSEAQILKQKQAVNSISSSIGCLVCLEKFSNWNHSRVMQIQGLTRCLVSLAQDCRIAIPCSPKDTAGRGRVSKVWSLESLEGGTDCW